MSKYAGKIVTNQAAAGYSVFFDGASDYLSLAANAAFAFGTGDFTVEFWVYYASASANYMFYDGRGTSISNTGVCIFNSGGIIYVNKAAATLVSATAPAANVWHHIAFSRSGSSNKLFVDGTQVGSTATDSTNYSTNYSVGIGAPLDSTYTAGYSLNGYLSNVRVVKGTALYTAAFTPPTQLLNVTNTSILTCNSPAIVDQSSNAFAITVNGNAAVSTFTPFAAYNPYNPSLGASTPGVWTLDEAMQAAATRQWNMYDPYFQNTTLLLHGNGTNTAQNNTFLDSSTNNFTITRNGNTTQGTFSPFSQTGWSNFFNGSSYLQAGSNAALAPGSGSFTVEFWVFPTAGNTFYNALYQNYTDGLSRSTAFRISINNADATSLLVQTQASALITTSTGVLTTNAWNHVALVRNGSGSNNLVLYVNGVSVGTATNTTNFSDGFAQIGNSVYNAANYYWNGYISNLRVVPGTAVYTSGFTPPTSPLTAITNTSLLTCQSNRFIDNSTNAFALTVTGNTSVQAFSPFYPTAAYTPATIGGSGYFDGTTDWLRTSSDITLDADFCLEAYLYITSLSGTKILFSSISSTPGTNVQIPRIQTNGGVYVYINGTQLDAGSTATDLGTLNQWNHFAMTRSGSTVRAFVNGIQIWSTTYSSSFGVGVVGQFYLSGSPYGGGYDYAGYMASVRVVKGSAVYTSNFTPPTAPLTAITNTQLLLGFTNAGIVDSTAKNVLETVGNAQISTTQSKFGGSSMYFDGSVDYLLARTNPAYLFGSGDFTVELWYYPTALTGTPGNLQTLVGMWGPGTASWLFYLSGGNLYWYTSTNGTTQTATMNAASGMSAGNWYHLALCRSGGTTRIFVNGTSIVSTTTVVALYEATCPLTIGYNPIGGTPDYAYGYIDDLRITKGVARYTANFTPQTSQWQDQ